MCPSMGCWQQLLLLCVSSLCLLLVQPTYGISVINQADDAVSKSPSGWIDPRSYHVLAGAGLPTYSVDDKTGLGKRFDGIGGLSGGGATSKLLVNYTEPQRTQILDYLFKPNFGASLQILKVEIGGDDQSSDGSESSHMHTEDTENYHTGYEWWLMTEAKRRNEGIKLYGLAWSFPGWIGDGWSNPYANVDRLCRYLVNWVVGAHRHHNLTIDYLGVWNERHINVTAIKALRSLLDQEGCGSTELVGGDEYMSDDMSEAILRHPDVARIVPIIGVHYPGTNSSKSAIKTGKVLWSSEDYSTYNNNTGAGCWARILNQNYVNGGMTSTIAWNLVASYYDQLAWKRNSLMTANQPWSGHYLVNNPIWVTAHTTQFTRIGWRYLAHGHGVGHLQHGGSFVSLTSPMSSPPSLTLIIETLTHNHSICVRPVLPPYEVAPYQQAVFTLSGTFTNISSLHVWSTRMGYGGQPDMDVFKYEGEKPVVGGQILLGLYADSILTLTTVSTGHKGSVPGIPKSQPFPATYTDYFEDYPLYFEPMNFAQQMGVFEIRESEDPVHGQVMQQVITRPPLPWCGKGRGLRYPMNVIGDYSWQDVRTSVEVMIPSGNDSAVGVFLAVRVYDPSMDGKGFGCNSDNATGLFFSVYPRDGRAALAGDVRGERVLLWVNVGPSEGVSPGTWFTMAVAVWDNACVGLINGRRLFSYSIPPVAAAGVGKLLPSHGFVAVGTRSFGLANFDNFYILAP